MDETGLQEGDQSNSNVFGSTVIRIREKPQDRNTAWISIIECISAEGKHIKPGAIFSGAMLWTDSTPDQPPLWIYTSSKSGFTNKHLMTSWFKQAFLVEANVDHPSDWRLLIMDGHGSHDSDEFRQLCSTNRVQPVYLPNNTSHELQPLDVGCCFSPLKIRYRRKIEDLGLLDLTASGSKMRFVRAYAEASKDAFKVDTIRSGFRHSGIWPFHPEYVLDRLRPQALPFTPPQRLNSPEVSLYLTPKNAAQLQ
jgi:4-hydroxybenzoate polyprenyltransferase